MSNLLRALYPNRSISIWDDPWFNVQTPSRLFDQQFGMALTDDDFHLPEVYRGMMVQPRVLRPRQQTGMSEVTNSDKEFSIKIDVQHFKPDEIAVKTVDNHIVISAKHEEKEDEHGYVCRSFTRRYVLPKDVDPKTVTSSLSPDGVLNVKAPKLALEAPQERTIPITHETTPAVMDSEMKE
ncbi:alpha-crystallin B chain-like [Gigantopelta aegis]|uniref:alpha-crystallin B chain-like n=1 Tax=Gigantopelta aegis TaxID=1735272 RepID=UPI001B88AE52|nr:alpha-crystallin B chain-like [Gigantopelta aegis]